MIKKVFKFNIFLILAFFLSLVLRIYLINLRSNPGGDEIWALELSKASFGDIWLGTLGDWHPPLYFFLLHVIKLVFPFTMSIFYLRLLSLIFGIAANFSIWYLATLIFGKRAGRITFVLSLFLPIFIWSSIYARYYSILVFLMILLTVIFLKFLESYKTRHLVFLVIISTVGIYTHYFFVFLVICCGVFLILSKKPWGVVRCWLIWVSSVGILFAPAFYYLFLLPKPPGVRLINHFAKIPGWFLANLESLEVMINLYYSQNNYIYILLLGIFSLVVAGLMLIGFRGWRNNLRWLLLAIIILPPFIVILLSYLVKPSFFAVGSMQIFMPAMILLIAHGIDIDLRKSKLLTTVFVFFILWSLIIFVNVSSLYQTKQRYLDYLIKNFKEGDIILHANITSYLQAKYYLGSDANLGVIHANWATPTTEKAIGYKVIDWDTLLSNKGRVWYLDPIFENNNQRKRIQILEDNLVLVKEESFRSSATYPETFFDVLLYERK